MKVYRIKHNPSGEYIKDTLYELRSSVGKIFTKKCGRFSYYEDNPDYEILYDEIKD